MRRRRRRYLTNKPGRSTALTAFREQSAVGVDDPPSSRDEVLARYRQFREISKPHHHDILPCISGDALLNQARRLGLAQGKTLILEDMEEMNYVYDLAGKTKCLLLVSRSWRSTFALCWTGHINITPCVCSL